MKWSRNAVSPGAGRWLVLGAAALMLAAASIGCAQLRETEDREDDDEIVGEPPPADEDPYFVEGRPEEAQKAESRGRIGDDDDTAQEEEGAGASDKRPHCFSCVAICPADRECDDKTDEVICGWGVDAEADRAKERARAECEATLDKARQTPAWTDIKGECPAATCR